MSVQIATVPDEIYLVFEYAEDGDDFKDFPEISWCADKISDNDVRFVRADRITALERENAELRAHIQEAADRMEFADEAIQHWHLAALQPKEKDHAE